MSNSLWLIGCGAMAGSMLRRWLETGLDPARVTVIDIGGQTVAPGIRVLTQPPNEPPPAMLMLGTKPQHLDELVPSIAPYVGLETLLLSILAGIRIERLRLAFPHARGIVRVMPNLPVALGKGVVALTGDAREEAEALMAPLGLVEWVADEDLLDVVTALSGSGPAFLYRFIESLARGGAALGLPAHQAARMALATVEGAGLLAAGAGLSPAALADRVASKGGSTREGLNILDDDAALDRLIEATLRAAAARNRELARV